MSEEEKKEQEAGTDEEAKQEEVPQGKKVPRKEYEKALAELEKANNDAAHWKNEYYRVYADTQNLRKSLDAERLDAIKYRASGFLEKLIPALDAFYMAMSMPASTPEVKNYLMGFQYIYNQMQAALEDEGVGYFEPKAGDQFDATKMHAVETVESDGEEGKVVKVLTKGYKLHDRLIRPAMVTVSKKKEVKVDEPQKEEDNAQKEETPDESHNA